MSSVFPATIDLSHWRHNAHLFQQEISKAVIGLDDAIRLFTICIFSRGHVMLEGDVGVGKTTLLRAVTTALGGEYERIEGTIDLMPNDLLYHSFIDEQGKPKVDPGPLLKHNEQLATFFFNEVNRARPQVHSLLLRVMAERRVSAFNRDYHFPHLQVFADRNRVEKEETFEIPSAARDRFLMELKIEIPVDKNARKELVFDSRFHQVDDLVAQVQHGILPFHSLNSVAASIQQTVHVSDTIQDYVLQLWEATRKPADYGVSIEGVDMSRLILAGLSPRAMSLLIQAARVASWLDDRNAVLPEDIQTVFQPVAGHRIFFTPAYELRRADIIDQLTSTILKTIAAP
ncbi:MAG: MoxR family ATPase [Gammaproteobacteria bacterium]|nr:MoxR family ATPase [Gammaproteobacteria bacterium]